MRSWKRSILILGCLIVLMLTAGCVRTLQVNQMDTDRQTYRSNQFFFLPKPYRIYLSEDEYIRGYDVQITSVVTMYRPSPDADFRSIRNSRVYSIAHTSRETGMIIGMIAGFGGSLLVTNLMESEPFYATTFLMEPSHFIIGGVSAALGSAYGFPNVILMNTDTEPQPEN